MRRGGVRGFLGHAVVEGADHGAGLFGEAVCRAHQMCGEDDRWDAGVGDADVGEAVDSKVCVDYAALAEWEHCAG